VEFISIAPFFGDFKFIEMATDLEIIVEAKFSHCWFLLEGDDSDYMTHVQLQRGERHIFQWKVQWDFLYTTHRDRV